MRRYMTGRSLLPIGLAAGYCLLASAQLSAQVRPDDSDNYCAGFFTTRFIEHGLTVQSSEDAGFKYEFYDRDYIYLNRGERTIVNTGGQYMLLRPITDNNRKESFPGQQMMVKSMGTLYSEIGRVEIKVVTGAHATAEVLRACEPIEPGDIAIPLNARSAPAYKSARQTPRFAPLSGKATGVIATSKEFNRVIAEGRIVYLNMGSGQGLQPGSYLHIVRPYSTDSDTFNQASRDYLTADGMRARTLTRTERAAMPREVIGEVMVLTAEASTATGIVTYSRTEVLVGDDVELE